MAAFAHTLDGSLEFGDDALEGAVLAGHAGNGAAGDARGEFLRGVQLGERSHGDRVGEAEKGDR